MRTMVKWTAAIVAAVMVAACGGQKVPAETAVKAAQEAFAGVSAEAQKYVPDQTKAIQDALTSAQSALTNGDYAAALQQAQALPAKITDLTSAIAAKKAELTQAWTAATSSIPNLVTALTSRVGVLSKSKHLPAGLTTATLAGAKSALATATQSWTDAKAAAASGDIAAAGAKAASITTLLTDAMKSLNMQVSGGN